MQLQLFVMLGTLAVANAGVPLLGGESTQHRAQDDYGNYQFSYDIVDPLGATNGRWEVGDAYGNKRGGYTITDIDGRQRRVEYVADAYGFRVIVNTNEPGTAASAPASAVFNSPYVNVIRGLALAKPVVAAAASAAVPVAHVHPTYVKRVRKVFKVPVLQAPAVAAAPVVLAAPPLTGQYAEYAGYAPSFHGQFGRRIGAARNFYNYYKKR
ncbi:hypothetical protein HPB50_008218 [Hyalomma asiaticum]|uniref:Uncharacterized protein n=1 Tax=Hyalomma asiaticum TaxID=266040 RepID=A0ACB7TEQ0_HYAAI|nr:hypothetical protein HPB50_008218 [Hyalomma asiaticum]